MWIIMEKCWILACQMFQQKLGFLCFHSLSPQCAPLRRAWPGFCGILGQFQSSWRGWSSHYRDKAVFGVPSSLVHVQRTGQPLPQSIQQALRYIHAANCRSGRVISPVAQARAAQSASQIRSCPRVDKTCLWKKGTVVFGGPCLIWTRWHLIKPCQDVSHWQLEGHLEWLQKAVMLIICTCDG